MKNLLGYCEYTAKQLVDFYGLDFDFQLENFLHVGNYERAEVITDYHRSSDQLFIQINLPSYFSDFNPDDIHQRSVIHEELSHFIYITTKLPTHFPLSLMELEYQAEVDKFLIEFINLANKDTQSVRKLWRRHFLFVRYHSDNEIYKIANYHAKKFWGNLLNLEFYSFENTKTKLRRFYQFKINQKKGSAYTDHKIFQAI